MADQPDAQVAAHRGGVDVELTIPWPTDESPVAFAMLEPMQARRLAGRLNRAATACERRRNQLGVNDERGSSGFS